MSKSPFNTCKPQCLIFHCKLLFVYVCLFIHILLYLKWAVSSPANQDSKALGELYFQNVMRWIFISLITKILAPFLFNFSTNPNFRINLERRFRSFIRKWRLMSSVNRPMASNCRKTQSFKVWPLSTPHFPISHSCQSALTYIDTLDWYLVTSQLQQEGKNTTKNWTKVELMDFNRHQETENDLWQDRF